MEYSFPYEPILIVLYLKLYSIYTEVIHGRHFQRLCLEVSGMGWCYTSKLPEIPAH